MGLLGHGSQISGGRRFGSKTCQNFKCGFAKKMEMESSHRKKAVWRDILEARYGNLNLKVLISDVSMVNKNDSIWWRDLLISDNYEQLIFEHFAGAIKCNLGNGVDIPLWYTSWARNKSLMELYPDLFAMAGNFLEAVNFEGDFKDGSWKWKMKKLFATASAT